MDLIIFPPVTPEGLYVQDKRRRDWDDRERQLTRSLQEWHLRRQGERKVPNPLRATQVLEAVARVLDTHHIPKTIEGRPPTLSERVRYLERAAANPN